MAKITIHKLVPPENKTAFVTNPQLNGIWEIPKLQRIARESYEEWGYKKRESTGEIFLIQKGRRTIGIIGWFIYGDMPTVLRLRYYGIIPSERGKGYAEEGMRLLLKNLAEVAPAQYRFLSESVSVKRKSAPAVARHFRKMGFRKFNDPNYGTNGFGPVLSLRIRIPGR